VPSGKAESVATERYDIKGAPQPNRSTEFLEQVEVPATSFTGLHAYALERASMIMGEPWSYRPIVRVPILFGGANVFTKI
jgi:hypothetical protein